MNPLEPPALAKHFITHPPRAFTAATLANGVVAFTAPFDVLTTADTAMRQRISRWPLHRHWRRWLSLRTRFIGTTVTEYAVFPEDVDPAVLARTLRREQSDACALLIIKDIPQYSPLLDDADNAWAAAFAAQCAREGFVLVEGQALAWVPIDFTSSDNYLARLSRGRRRDLRRKLRSRTRLEISTIPTGTAFNDDALIDEFHHLYRNVYEQSEIHFDFLERAFLAAVLRDADAGGIVFVYRHEGRMIGWNLCFEYAGALVDKLMGLAYPASREHNLYAISWFENLDYARRRGLHRYIAGWTDPQVKADLGARFTFTRHAVYPRNRLLRLVLRHLAGHFESDRAWRDARTADAAIDP
ncbi:MAG: GNAT family N-acetyltransferase [Lysobacter sp.]|nr:MAG: GNAT family N-acetyltransferase [Lysobacter sp.]